MNGRRCDTCLYSNYLAETKMNMNNYPEMTNAELEEELDDLKVTGKAPGNHTAPVPTTEELQTMLADLQADQSNNFLVFSALKTMEGLVHELQVYQVELEMQNRELREARQSLEAEQQRYVDLYDFAPNGYVTLDEKGVIQAINLPGAQLLGKERSYLLGKPFMVYVAKGESRPFLAHLRRCQQGEEKVTTELTLKGDRARQIQLLSIPVRDEVQHREFYRTALLDITERKQAESAVRESEARLAGILNSAMDAIITTDAEQRIILFNAAAEEMFRCPAHAAIGQPLDQFMPARYHGTHAPHVHAFGATKTTKRRMGGTDVIYGLRANGEEFPMESSISQVEIGGQHFFTVIHRDITERKQAERRLIEQAAMLNQAQEAILVRDLDGGIRFWNQGAERLYGWSAEEVVGRPVKDLLYRGNTSQVEQAMQAVVENGEWVGEIRQFAKDGRELVIDAHWTLIRDEQGAPQSILAINSDITEKKQLEAQFLRAQRLESIGTLASGIAHDLNNVLSPVLMAVQLLQMRLPDESSQRILDVLQQNVLRGSEMVKQVLSFARGTTGERVTIQPKHLLKEVIAILREIFPKNITVHYSVPSDLHSLSGDPTQIHQVLMNLCVNARDAMQASGGTLTIAAENKFVDQQFAGMTPNAKPGQYVVITIADTGTGIAPDLLDKIFDPFFTTKGIGHGTGLGLSTVHSIIKSHGGFVTVYSEVGKGTSFHLYLPELAAAPPLSPAALPTDLPMGQGELILVVDDERAIREITQGTLEAYGYRVLTAADGTEAIVLYAQHKDEVRLVLTDMMMPYLDGPALIRSLQKINPAVEVIASSGLTETERAREAELLGVKTYLIKPYTAQDLLHTLHNALLAMA
jgi:two-component system, cell cycle sensor histidine kinase and response regulator CckA